MTAQGRTRVKVCGITRVDDGLAAARLGADAIGLVFYRKSPRAVAVDQAAGIAAAMPPFVTVVGLFVDPEPAEVEAVLRQVPLELLQFHGREAPDLCAAFGRPYIKAIAMGDAVDLELEARRYSTARGLLVDTHRPGVPGGTGEVFDWDRVPQGLHIPLVLAGGLRPGNVAEAIRRVRPYGVDVSSGVEASPGVKDPAKIGAFMGEVGGV